MNKLMSLPIIDSSIGFCTGTFMDAEVIDGLTYIPSNNTFPEQKCIIKIYIRKLHNKNNDGRFTIVAKGKMADICACHLSEFRKLDCIYIPHSHNDKLELVIKNIVFGSGPNIIINTKTKKYISGNKFGFAKVVHSI